ncbi:unnamed protein product [Hydatigera taeniaeformis]|uniref:Protein-tyrosine-phosphatase n=1 Tax=Hydatigena taeniaeformis TaxID=6205 RepID=A0A158RDG0_HYDTA|nr:unnamed protein product [Hydatigera taeniaeformis]
MDWNLVKALRFDRLDISNVSRRHEGNYSCFRNGRSAASCTLFVLDIPTLPNNLSLSALNQSAIFLQWKNDRQVPKSLFYEVQVKGPQNKSVNVSAKQQDLVVNGLRPYSKYFVRFTPGDQVGLGPNSFNGGICTKPGTPTAAPNITLISFTNTSATFNFSAGDITPVNDNIFSCPGSYEPPEHLFGPFLGFKLALETLFFKSDITFKSLDNRTESHTMDKLSPYTSYRVNVSIFNGRTSGPPAVLNFTTLEGLPDPPLLQVEFRSTNSFQISLISSNKHGIVLGYLIKWTECSNSSAEASAETKETHYTIQGLRNATCYHMRAAARTSVGLGDFSPLTPDFTSCPDLPPPTLSNISAMSEGIKISWVYTDPPASPDGNYWFWTCMESMTSKTCEELIFNSTFRHDGTFSYVFPFHDVNLLGGHEIVLNFTVRSICRLRDCEVDWPCKKLSNISNVLQLDLNRLAEMFYRPSGFSEFSDKAIGGIIGAVFAIFLMLCCFGALFIFYCRSSRVYKRRGGGSGVGNDYGMGCGGGDRLDDARTPLVAPKMRSFEDSPYKPIPAERLAQHVASYHVDDDAGYQAEFEAGAIEQSVRTSWPTSVARLPDNMTKNRYTNVFPYDHTRVILKNGRKSDYINANYVDGFCRPRAFIAAQGPKDTTFDDFWQMVWDENSNIIVMISNFVERGRRKCDQYWPSSGPQTYGNISVQMLSENYLACYVARVFLVKNVKCKKFTKERIVRHYQYTDWRDFDVPPSPLPVLVFVKTTIKEWTPSRGPIIVHCRSVPFSLLICFCGFTINSLHYFIRCLIESSFPLLSAGVGRTGTYICIESLIRQLEAEKQVNIRGFLEHIRQQRMKLVQTEQQYAFIHDALREYLLCPEHEISALAFPAYVQCLRLPDAAGVTGLQKQFEASLPHSCLHSALFHSTYYRSPMSLRPSDVSFSIPCVWNFLLFMILADGVMHGDKSLYLFTTQHSRIIITTLLVEVSQADERDCFTPLGVSAPFQPSSLRLELNYESVPHLPLQICTDHLPRVYEFTEARKPVNVTKNRLQRRLLPTDSRRVVLPSEGGVEGASYINASVVQGYHRLQEFIITQHPIPGTTEADFWRMVWDKNSSLVVVLSSEQADLFPDFWPIEAHNPQEIGWLRVGFCNSEEVSEGLTRYEFLLSSSREDYALTCQLWRLHAWPITVTEEACSDFLRLQSILVSNHTSAANGSTIIVDDIRLIYRNLNPFLLATAAASGQSYINPRLPCSYGGNRAGIFVAVNFLINQLTLSGYIDVYYVVKMLHLQRTGIFESPSDLDFIYSVMEQFLLDMQQQDDSSSFLGNETNSSPGYANLSLFSGKLLFPVTHNSKNPSANGDAIPLKSTLLPLTATSMGAEDPLNAVEKTEKRQIDVEEEEPALELHSLTSNANSGDVSISPSLIGVLTSVKRPLNNGFVVKEMVLPPPLPPPPNQSPPPWPPRPDNLEVQAVEGEVSEGEDPTPTTSLVVEGGSNLNLNNVNITNGSSIFVSHRKAMSSVSPTSNRPILGPQSSIPSSSTGIGLPRHPPPVRLPVPKRPPLTPSAIFTLIQTIKETGRRLGMSDCAVATACTLFHRMVRVLTVGEETGPFAAMTMSGESEIAAAQPATYSVTNDNPLPSAIDGSIRSSLGDVDPYTMAMACISLGAKVQEEHQRLRDVIVAYYRTLHKTKRPPLEVGEEYDRLRVSLVSAELFLMRLLGYAVRTRADLPHAYLLHYLSALLHWIGKGIAHPPETGAGDGDVDSGGVYASHSALALARLPGLAWAILMDSYHAPLCVDYAPEYIAASILHLALRIAGVEVPGNRHSESAWWQAISDSLSRETVEQIQLKVMDIYAVDDRINAMANYRPDEEDDY